MNRLRSWMIVVSLALVGAPLTGCDTKSCDEWIEQAESQCCAGKTNCTLVNKSEVQTMCKTVEDKCGSRLECKASVVGASCTVQCGCG